MTAVKGGASDADARIEALYEGARFGEQFPVADEDALRAVMRESADTLEIDQLMQVLPSLFSLLSRDRCQSVVQPYLCRYVDSKLVPFADLVNSPAPEGRRVVFITSEINYKLYREALYLRRNGFRTFLISLVNYNDEIQRSFEPAFEVCLRMQFNLNLLGELLQRLKPDIYHVHCNMFSYSLARAVIDAKGTAPVVCDLNDITTVYAEPEVLAMVMPMDKVELDYAMERYLCHHADGLLYQFADGVQDELRERHGALPPAMQMQPYPCPEFVHHVDERHSDGDGIMRCVFPGNTPPIAPTHPPEVYPSRTIINTAETLCAQGIGVDIILDPSKPLDAMAPNFAAWRELGARYPHFRILNGVAPDRISEAICRHDFGLLHNSLDWSVLRCRRSKIALQMPNKFYTYMEAGIPVLVDSEFAYPAELVREHGLGLVLSKAELPNAAEHMAAFDRRTALRNIKRFNERFGMERQIHRLIEFYASLTGAAPAMQRAVG